MMDTFLDFMLGPMRAISDFYFEYQVIFNTIIVGLVVFKLFFGKKKVNHQEGDPNPVQK
ncbi:hypothetical protein [Virgibacillus kimchii]